MAGGTSRRLVSVVALALACLGHPSASAHQGDDFTLARGRVGALRLGMTADEVIALFGADHVRPLEDPLGPGLDIRLGDPSRATAPSMTADILPGLDKRVWRVTVFDPRFKTARGLGVGSTLGEIRALHDVEVYVGDNSVYTSWAAAGMSFNFGARWYPSTVLPEWAHVQSVSVVAPPTMPSHS